MKIHRELSSVLFSEFWPAPSTIDIQSLTAVKSCPDLRDDMFEGASTATTWNLLDVYSLGVLVYLGNHTVISVAAVLDSLDRERGGGGQSITRSVEDAINVVDFSVRLPVVARACSRIPPATRKEVTIIGGNRDAPRGVQQL